MNPDSAPDALALRPRVAGHAVVVSLLALLLPWGSAQDMTIPVCDEATRPVDLDVGDIDGDGRPDLLVGCGRSDGPASSAPGHLEVLLGRPNGYANAKVMRDFPYGVGAVALGDLAGDRAPDVALNVSGPHERTMVVLPNDGDGAFGKAVTSGTDFTVSEPAVVDADGDGDADLLMPGTSHLFRNDGDATVPGPFARSSLVGRDERSDVHLADVDADGHADVAHVLPSAGKIRLYATGGDTPEAVLVGKAVREVQDVLGGGDPNGDGTVDLVVTSSLDPHTAEVRLALSDGDEWRLTAPMPSLGDPMMVLVGDVDGDGVDDLVAVPAARPDTEAYALRIAHGAGDGTFGEAVEWPVDAFPYRAILRDVNGDSSAEVLYVDMEASVIRIASAPLAE